MSSRSPVADELKPLEDVAELASEAVRDVLDREQPGSDFVLILLKPRGSGVGVVATGSDRRLVWGIAMLTHEALTAAVARLYDEDPPEKPN